jgi:hypothetical protein
VTTRMRCGWSFSPTNDFVCERPIRHDGHHEYHHDDGHIVCWTDDLTPCPNPDHETITIAPCQWIPRCDSPAVRVRSDGFQHGVPICADCDGREELMMKARRIQEAAR